MYPCYGQGHELVPENPDRLQGPEVGALVRYRGYRGRHENVVARVLARSYVWSPEQHREDGYHGHRRYDWTVIQFGPGESKRMVVDDADLFPIEPGDYVIPDWTRLVFATEPGTPERTEVVRAYIGWRRSLRRDRW